MLGGGASLEVCNVCAPPPQGILTLLMSLSALMNPTCTLYAIAFPLALFGGSVWGGGVTDG